MKQLGMPSLAQVVFLALGKGCLELLSFFYKFLVRKNDLDLDGKINLVRQTGTPIRNLAVIELQLEGQNPTIQGRKVPTELMAVTTLNEIVQNQQLHEIVAERLREAILAGKLKPGEFIRQNQIAEEYGVSQIPVREALKDLVAESLLEHIPYRGVRVIKYSIDDLADIFALRSFLEGRAAAAAAEQIAPEDIDKLTDLTESMKAFFTANNLTAYREVNQQFHELIYSSSNRVYLIQNLDKIWSSFPTMIHGNFPQSGDQIYKDWDRRDYHDHLQIIKALKERNSGAAELAMRKHIDHASQDLINNLTLEQAKEVKE